MVGRNWFTISQAGIISLIIVNSTLRGEEGKKRENKGCICKSCKQKSLIIELGLDVYVTPAVCTPHHYSLHQVRILKV